MGGDFVIKGIRAATNNYFIIDESFSKVII